MADDCIEVEVEVEVDLDVGVFDVADGQTCEYLASRAGARASQVYE